LSLLVKTNCGQRGGMVTQRIANPIALMHT